MTIDESVEKVIQSLKEMVLAFKNPPVSEDDWAAFGRLVATVINETNYDVVGVCRRQWDDRSHNWPEDVRKMWKLAMRVGIKSWK